MHKLVQYITGALILITPFVLLAWAAFGNITMCIPFSGIDHGSGELFTGWIGWC